MIDLHTHILPEIDDGSSSVDISLELLEKERRQNAGTVVLTPHFYPWRDKPEYFFAKREQAWQKLSAALPNEHPKLFLGAEFAWYDGISHTPEIFDFRIQGTELFLLEMPFVRWTDRMIEDVLRLNDKRHIQVVLAHVDRYFRFSGKDMLERLLEAGVIFQFNAEAFLTWHSRMKVLKLMRKADSFFIGSDCHNLTSRPPRIAEAMQVLRQKGGQEAVRKLKYTEAAFFQGGDQ